MVFTNPKQNEKPNGHFLVKKIIFYLKQIRYLNREFILDPTGLSYSENPAKYVNVVRTMYSIHCTLYTAQVLLILFNFVSFRNLSNLFPGKMENFKQGNINTNKLVSSLYSVK